MKKGIIALLVALALIVLISPGLVGRMAEKSVDDNLNWAAEESGALVVTSENFDRGWFSSQGQHRVQIDGDKLKALMGSIDGAPDPGDFPVLVIDTRLDHGLIPLGSMSREKGSLAPGLGSAVSTLSVELADGETVDLPGAVYSKVSIGGALSSNYVLPAGSMTEDGSTVSWNDTNIDVTTNPSSGKVSFGGDLGSYYGWSALLDDPENRTAMGRSAGPLRVSPGRTSRVTLFTALTTVCLRDIFPPSRRS